MVQAWLDEGIDEVLWIDPYPSRLPNWGDLRRRGGVKGEATFDARVQVLRVPALPIEPLPGGAFVNRRLLWKGVLRTVADFSSNGRLVLGIGKPCAFSRVALAELAAEFSFYDAMDDFPEFHRGLSQRSVRRHEDAIAAGVDLVVCSSSSLADKFAQRGHRIERILNAYPMAGLQDKTQQRYSSDSTICGYVGCLGGWFDWPLVFELASQLADVQFELIGPCAVPPPRRLPTNVRLLPECSREQAVAHARRFTAGLIPFRLNRLTAGVDPIKFYEYRGLGLSVLTTRFGEMAERPNESGVFFLDRPGEFATVARAAFAYRSPPAEIAAFHRVHDWRARFAGSQLFAMVKRPVSRAA
jgi:hypothetical protein